MNKPSEASPHPDRHPSTHLSCDKQPSGSHPNSPPQRARRACESASSSSSSSLSASKASSTISSITPALHISLCMVCIVSEMPSTCERRQGRDSGWATGEEGLRGVRARGDCAMRECGRALTSRFIAFMMSELLESVPINFCWLSWFCICITTEFICALLVCSRATALRERTISRAYVLHEPMSPRFAASLIDRLTFSSSRWIPNVRSGEARHDRANLARACGCALAARAERRKKQDGHVQQTRCSFAVGGKEAHSRFGDRACAIRYACPSSTCSPAPWDLPVDSTQTSQLPRLLQVHE